MTLAARSPNLLLLSLVWMGAMEHPAAQRVATQPEIVPVALADSMSGSSLWRGAAWIARIALLVAAGDKVQLGGRMEMC